MAATLEVSEELRYRIDKEANERGVAAAAFIEGVLDGYEQRIRMESFGRARRGADAGYRDEFREWDSVTTPGDGTVKIAVAGTE